MAKPAKDATPEDQAFLRTLVQRLAERRWALEKQWWGNLLTLFGFHWIVWDNAARRWRLRKLSPSVPTPVTNLYRATLDTVKSVLAQHDPRFVATPERDDPHAVAAAASADTTLQIILSEGRFRRTRRRMLDWLITTGTAVIEPVFDDSDDTGLVDVPFEHCDACGTETPPSAVGDDKQPLINENDPKCPACQSPLLSDSTTQFETVPRGAMRFDVHSPFDVLMDPAIEELEDQPIIVFRQSFTPEQVYIRWNVEVDPDTDLLTTGMNLRDAVSTIGTGGGGASPMGTGGGYRRNRVTVYRAMIKYHKEYPDGAYLALTAGGKELEKRTPYPWKRRRNGRAFFPPVLFRFGTAGGRAWGYTPADDLMPKQHQLNKAESLFTMIMSRMANPVWMIPLGSNPTRITGDIGIQIEYTPTGQIGPTKIPGSEAPQSLVKYIVDIRQSFDELSGAFSAVRGRAIGTRTPVGTTQALIDRGFGRWATVFDSLEEGYEDLAKNCLEIWRQSSAAPRVQAIKNALGGWTFSEFSRADWDDGVDIQVEAGSTRPRTQAERLQTYGQLLQSGLIDGNDQAQRIKILEDVGMANMLVGVEQDTQEAYKENADFMAWAQQIDETVGNAPMATDPETADQVHGMMSAPPIMVHPLVDNHALHFLAHRRLCLTQDFKHLSEATQNIMFMHMQTHQMDIGQSAIMTPLPGTAAPGTAQPPSKPSSGAPVTSGAK